MDIWAQGGVAAIGYTHAFYPELAPALTRFALAAKGVAPPPAHAFAYAEPGCGQGLTSLMLAALHPGASFQAMDILPEHIQGAAALAREAGLGNVHFTCEDFAAMAARPGPQLDYVGLHGIWTWVDADSRAVLAAFLRDRLKPGGAVTISYNCLPGWQADLPARALLLEHVATATGPLPDRIDAALEDLCRHPLHGRFFQSLADKSAAYIAHEYLNRNWTCFFPEQVAAEVAPLEYAASATMLELPQPRFRRDIFVNAPRRLNTAERREILSDMVFALAVPPDQVPEGLSTPAEDITLPTALRRHLVERLARPNRLGDLLHGQDFEDGLKVLVLLIGLGAVVPGIPGGHGAGLNRAILRANRLSPAIRQLAAPALGTGLVVDVLERLFLLAEMEGQDPAALAWAILQGRGKRLRRDGMWLDGDDNRVELERLYAQFRRTRRPFLDQAGILTS